VALWIALLVLAAADATLASQAHTIPDSARVLFFLFQIGGVGSVVYAAIRYHASLLDAEKTEQVALNERLRQTADELSLTLARLEETNAALAEAGRQKSRFLASMSHELRTPLNAIIGYSEMLEEEAAELGKASFAEDLQKIHVSGRHLLGLIDDVLDLSKIEAGRMQMFAERLDVTALVAGIVKARAKALAARSAARK
jgi:signal transduction histidine kinase